MTLEWVEDKSSRAGTIVRLGTRGTASYTKSYKVFGTDDDTVLHADINARAGDSLLYWEYPGTDVKLWVENYSVAYLGDKCWQVTLHYEKKGADDDESPDPLKRSRSFETVGGTQHITQGISSIDYLGGEKSYANGGNAPFQFGAIGVDDDRVNGVDIAVPALKWTEQYDIPSSYVTSAYIRTVARISATLNNAAFRGFAKGEVLFLGATGSHEWDSERGDGPWNITYSFVASPNAGEGQTLPALTVGQITNIVKGGHDYMWVRYEPSTDGFRKISRPKFVYVNKVYRDEDFGQLGIGTT